MDTLYKIQPIGLRFNGTNRPATIADLHQLREELVFEIGNLLRSQSSAGGKQWVKSYEVRKILHISPGTLQTLRNNGNLPFARIGGILYYDMEDINNLLIKSKTVREL